MFYVLPHMKNKPDKRYYLLSTNQASIRMARVLWSASGAPNPLH